MKLAKHNAQKRRELSEKSFLFDLISGESQCDQSLLRHQNASYERSLAAVCNDYNFVDSLFVVISSMQIRWLDLR